MPPQIIPGLGVDVTELRQARALWQANRFDDALDLFEKAVRKYPQNLVALVDASRALGARFEIAKAEPLLDRLAKLGAHNPELMHLAGQSYRMIFRPEKPIACFEQILDSHPGLVSSDEREAFGRDIFPAMWRTEATPLPTVEALDQIPQDRLATQRERYLSYMAAALNQPIGDRVHLDKNPTMTFLLPGLLRLFPELNMLIALRDPRDVVVSCFMQYLPLNPNSVCFLTLEQTAKRYAHDLGVWLKLREIVPAPWLEVRYEDCVRNLEREARRALAFLDLPWEPQVLQYRERMKSKAISSPTYQAVSKPLYTSAIGRWRNYQKYLEPCLEILDPCIKAFGY